MKETSKATERRRKDPEFWSPIFSSAVIDVGAGDDPLIWPEAVVTPFDVGDGDANELHKFVGAKAFDTLHASQCLEHMHDPYEALRSWARVCRKYIVFTVPDFVLYEKLNWPSRWNPDHKSTWSDYLPESPAREKHVFLPKFVEWVGASGLGEVILCRLVTANYDFTLGPEIDQTFVFENGVECFHEVVISVSGR